ncbi:haloacid dehalogenase [Halovivax asiaticus JCM 14624]|uniref:Haloacid dehalogenase n=1 Tax=Halovivax asiaticus JCM 14624 TaxID=1227490 RepID=M0BC03_9EURY|nr:HAD family hydrolase [Halovivax asiaticus]ELZ08355.1 haloacid dehalogenase [Halovivax asiaticus JCM 14624]
MGEGYDYWLLDLDGTLVDVEWSYVREVFDQVGTRLDRPFSDAEAETLWHGLTGSRSRQLRQWGVDPDPFWNVFHDVEDPAVRAEATYLYDDAAFVADLEEPVGLVTHCQSFLTEPILDQLDIADWFDAVCCCTDETGWKPDPTPVEGVVAELADAGGTGTGASNHTSVTSGSGVLAGDGACDVGAAWNAGLDAIHVDRHGPEQRGHCVRGDHRISSFDELDIR